MLLFLSHSAVSRKACRKSLMTSDWIVLLTTREQKLLAGRSEKQAESRRVKYWITALAVLASLSAAPALADDFKTINGKEYKNVKISRVEPDGIVLRTKSGISKIYFTELPKETQERFGYHAANGDAYSAEQRAKLEAAWKRQEPDSMATSGVEGLPPITVELKNEILNALRMTDKLDALYKRGCSSAEFIAAATPIEGVFINLHNKLPKGDPRRDLIANTFGAYQQAAVAMVAHEQGKGQRPDATIGAAGVRKGLLMKVLEGNMTANEKQLYQAWLQGHP